MKFILLYFVVINIITVITFVIDKMSATRGGRRVSEITLHILALMGGVYIMMLLMHFIHHKNKKFSFYIITLIIGVIWLGIIYYVLNYHLLHNM